MTLFKKYQLGADWGWTMGISSPLAWTKLP